jgi:hypothetical protein
MTTNQTRLDETDARIQQFDAELEPERLREAYMALENVDLSQEHDAASRARVRASALSAWLRLLHVLDRYLDPAFDPDEAVERNVQPPPLPDGTLLQPNADPARIPDPAARAAYEKALADNRAKAERHRLQVYLHRLDERIPPRAEGFLRGAYTADPRDQAELRAAIDQLVTDPKRKAWLLKIVGKL